MLKWISAGVAAVGAGVIIYATRKKNDHVEAEVHTIDGDEIYEQWFWRNANQDLDGLGDTEKTLIQTVAGKVSCPSGTGKQVLFARTGLFLGKYKWQVVCINKSTNQPHERWYLETENSDPVTLG